MAVVSGTTKWDDMTIAVVPFLFSVSLVQHGATTFVLLVSATPFLYGAYFAVLGIFAFIQFRLFARMFSAVLPAQEVRMCG
jgi:ABC-type multidrug transport system permease subunit